MFIKFFHFLTQAITALGNSEILVATTLLMALGTSMLTLFAGLSTAMGAFLAGLILAETDFALQVMRYAPLIHLLLGRGRYSTLFRVFWSLKAVCGPVHRHARYPGGPHRARGQLTDNLLRGVCSSSMMLVALEE